MTALTRLVGPAAALLKQDVNTDIIAPLVRGADGGMQPVGLQSREALAARLFGPWRYDAGGQEVPEFVLNREPFRQARFLIGGPNFGCGSSRESAAMMLDAFGIRCVIAPSFGLIFHDNCFRNHMLPLVLERPVVESLGALAEAGGDFDLDLEASVLKAPDGAAFTFTLPHFRREMLLKGVDEVQYTLGREADIAGYQARVAKERPWELQTSGR